MLSGRAAYAFWLGRVIVTYLKQAIRELGREWLEFVHGAGRG
jgi:hypothetical protein